MASSAVVVIVGDAHVGHVPLRVRLQVWYSSDGPGKSSDVNQRFAHGLSQVSTDGWGVQPVQADINSKNKDEHFVPIEAEFEYRPSSDQVMSPAESLSNLFNKTLPPYIHAFLREFNKKPKFVNIYPVTEDLTDEMTQMYKHWGVVQSLAQAYDFDAQDAPLDHGITGQTIRKIGSALPGTASLVVDLFDEVKTPSNALALIKGEPSTIELSFKDIISKACQAFEADDDPFDQTATAEMKASWRMVLLCTKGVQELVGDMQECATKISQGTGTVVSDQDLYNIVHHTACAMQLFTILQTAMNDLRIQSLGKYEKGNRRNTEKFIICAAILISSALIGSLPAVCGIGVGIASGAGTIFKGWDIWKTEKKKWTISQFDNMVPKLGKALGDAQRALSAKFCTQVLRISPNDMSRDHRKDVLRKLGVDISELGDEKFTDELVVDRVTRLASVYGEFEKWRESVRKDVAIRDMKLAAPRALPSSD